MNRYCYMIMLCGLFTSPCCASDSEPTSTVPSSFKPEFPTGSPYAMKVVTIANDNEPSFRTPSSFKAKFQEPSSTNIKMKSFPEETPKPEITQTPFVEPTAFVEPSMVASSSSEQAILPTLTPGMPLSSSAIIPPASEEQSVPIQAQRQLLPPALRPSSLLPSTPTIAPMAQPPVRSSAQGKAYENISKANSKLSSALRRLDAIRGYYQEISQEERRVIKAKAENLLKEYQIGITKFAQRITQAKNELGDRADKDKLAPFNTFVDLVHKLSQGIKKL